MILTFFIKPAFFLETTKALESRKIASAGEEYKLLFKNMKSSPLEGL